MMTDNMIPPMKKQSKMIRKMIRKTMDNTNPKKTITWIPI